jgi:hypothetical protein
MPVFLCNNFILLQTIICVGFLCICLHSSCFFNIFRILAFALCGYSLITSITTLTAMFYWKAAEKIEYSVAKVQWDVSSVAPLGIGCCFEAVYSGTGYLFFFLHFLPAFYDLAEKFIICINTPFHDHCKKLNETNEIYLTKKHARAEVYMQSCYKLQSIECTTVED